MTLASPAQAIWNGYAFPQNLDPWIVGVITTNAGGGGGACTGTLLQKDIVLTAAHCLPAGGNGSMRVSIGPGSSPYAPAYSLAVADWRYPSGFNLNSMRNNNGTNKDDIALLRLATPANSQTISLQSTPVAVGQRVEAIGWGCTAKPKPGTTGCANPHATVANAAHFTVSSFAACSSNFWNPPLSQETGMCAISKNSAINHGDSGGPLVISDGNGGFRQVGVASVGSDNSKSVGYGGWTSIASKAPWINSSIDSLHGVTVPPQPQPDYCPNGDYSGSPYDGTCGTAPQPQSGPAIHLYQGGSATYGYWYNVSLTGFAPGSQVTLTCRDSVDPGGFWNQTFTIDGAGNAGDSTLCYSGDHPDHWVTGAGYESNHLTW